MEKLNKLNALVSLYYSFEFDAKELCGQVVVAASKTFLQGKGFNQLLETSRQSFLGMAKNIIVTILETQGLKDTVKVVDCDNICLSARWPKYKNGIYHTIHLPGFTKVLLEKVLA